MRKTSPAARASDRGPAASAGDPVKSDPWAAWREFTPARIALGHAGAGLPTSAMLDFGWAHALARDAIHAPLDVVALGRDLAAAGWGTEQVHSQAKDRTTYLRRPDLGRLLDDRDRLRLIDHGSMRLRSASPDLCLIVGDGLSSFAAQRHAVPFLSVLRSLLQPTLRMAPVMIATQARVALGDDIGAALGARFSVMLIGERPGLSSPDSLGIYLTMAPRRGRTDAERNCISNVRPQGLSYAQAAHKLAWLIHAADRMGTTGVALKERSDQPVLPLDVVNSEGRNNLA